MPLMKYKSVKLDTPDGRFDSKKEYARWQELKKLEAEGKIEKLQRQKGFELIPKQILPEPRAGKRKKQNVELPVVYICDFYYELPENHWMVVEDTKGFRTADYIIKRKLMLWRYGIQIKEV